MLTKRRLVGTGFQPEISMIPTLLAPKASRARKLTPQAEKFGVGPMRPPAN
jgi:hypothetical protein